MGDTVVQWQEPDKQFCLLLEFFSVGESSKSLQLRCEPPHCESQTAGQRLAVLFFLNAFHIPIANRLIFLVGPQPEG